MLQGVAAPQIALVTTPVLSARPQFNFGQSSLVFTPTKAYEPSKLQDGGVDDLAKSLREAAHRRDEAQKQEVQRKQLELAEKRQEEMERHNRMTERIRAASEGIEGVGGGGDSLGESSDVDAMKAMGMGGPLSYDLKLSEVPEVAAKASKEQRQKNTKAELPTVNVFEAPAPKSINLGVTDRQGGLLSAPLTLNIDSEQPNLANVDVVSPVEEVGTPEEEQPTVTYPSKLAALSAPSSESQAAVNEQLAILKAIDPASLEKARQSVNKSLDKQNLQLGGALNQAASIFDSSSNEKKIEVANATDAPLPSRADDEAAIGRGQKEPTITLKQEELPYNRFASAEIARKYASAVMRGTPEYKANPPEPIKNSKGRVIGYSIKWENNTEAIQKRQDRLAAELEKKTKIAADQAVAQSKLLLQTGRAVNSSDDVRNYTRSNGFRSALVRFIPAYESASNPNAKNKGVSDIDLIDTYARAMSGGKVTENQVHLIKKAKNTAEIAEVFLREKIKDGSQLSQSQRDTMLRNMLESHNGDASIANVKMSVAREQLLKKGITDEAFLPQLYTADVKLKDDVAHEQNLRLSRLASLRLDAEKVNNDKLRSPEQKRNELAIIKQEYENEFNEFNHYKELLEKQKYSGSKILNGREFMKAKGGFLAGDMLTGMQTE